MTEKVLKVGIKGTDDRARSLSGDNSGNLYTKLTGSPEVESKVVTTTLVDSSYVPKRNDYEVLILQNLDSRLPIEVTLDSEFYGTFDNPSDVSNVIKIEAGQVVKLRRNVNTLRYKSLAGMPKLKILFGLDAEISSLPDKSTFDPRMIRMTAMAVDRFSSTIFFGSSDKIFKSIDGGNTYTTVYTFPDGEHATNMFYTKNGTLLVRTSKRKLYRSTDEGINLTEVFDDIWNWRAADTIEQDTQTGTIILGENPPNAPAESSVRLLRSTDDGQTWTEVLSRTREQIRHFHSVQIDPYKREWLATTGDTDSEVEWWKSTDDGQTWTAIVGADSGVPGDQMYRVLGVIFKDDEYVFASDNPLWQIGTNFISTAPKDDLAAIKKGMPLEAPAYAHYQIGQTFFVGTMPEGSVMGDKVARLYQSNDAGENWEEVIAWRVDDNLAKGGFSSFLPPDSDGNLYIQAANMIGCGRVPWYYATLKLSLK